MINICINTCFFAASAKSVIIDSYQSLTDYLLSQDKIDSLLMRDLPEGFPIQQFIRNNPKKEEIRTFILERNKIYFKLSDEFGYYKSLQSISLDLRYCDLDTRTFISSIPPINSLWLELYKSFALQEIVNGAALLGSVKYLSLSDSYDTSTIIFPKRGFEKLELLQIEGMFSSIHYSILNITPNWTVFIGNNISELDLRLIDSLERRMKVFDLGTGCIDTSIVSKVNKEYSYVDITPQCPPAGKKCWFKSFFYSRRAIRVNRN